MNAALFHSHIDVSAPLNLLEWTTGLKRVGSTQFSIFRTERQQAQSCAGLRSDGLPGPGDGCPGFSLMGLLTAADTAKISEAPQDSASCQQRDPSL